MNFSYVPPPTASSGALRSFETDYPEEVQPTGAGAYATEAPAPNYSAGLIRNSQPQIPGVGQRALPAFESHLPPPQETAVRPLQHSTNQLTGDGGSRGWDESYGGGGGGGGSLSGFVHQNYSSNGVVGDHYSGGEAPGISGLAQQRDRSNNGLAGDDTTTFDSLPNARHSMTGNKFKNAYKLFNQFDS